MNILKKLRYPLIWISESIIKYLIRKLIFKNLAKNDFKNLLSYTLDLLPHETFINTIKLLINTFKSKPVELTNIKIIDEVMTHTIPIEQRTDVIKKAKYLFIFLILGNIFKRSLFLVKNIILLPFKLGVYSFLASLFGIRPDYFLSFFEIFKFNLPSWTYNKLLELHISWLSWWKNTLNVGSISTDFNNKLSLPKPNTEYETIIPSEPKSETYLYLTKTQWFYVSITLAGLLAAYFGYTGGIPFTKSFDWESKTNDGDDTDGGDILIEREKPKTWVALIKNKINPFNWWSTPVESDFEYQERKDKKILEHFQAQDAKDAKDHEARTIKAWEQKYRKMDKYWFNKLENNESEERLVKPEARSRWRFLSKWWSSDNDTDLIRTEQLNKKEGLNPLDRAELRKEYSETKFTSPTHSDPEVSKEYNKLFPKPDPIIIKDNTTQDNTQSTSTSPMTIKRKAVPSLDSELTWSQSLMQKPKALWTPEDIVNLKALREDSDLWEQKNIIDEAILSDPKAIEKLYPNSSLYSVEDANASTDTITPSNAWAEVKGNTFKDNNFDNIPTDVTASDFTPLTRPEGSSSWSSSEGSMDETHTYPPRFFGKNRILNYYPSSIDPLDSQPFARGFQEEIDPELNIQRGSVVFSSSFWDNYKKNN